MSEQKSVHINRHWSEYVDFIFHKLYYNRMTDAKRMFLSSSLYDSCRFGTKALQKCIHKWSSYQESDTHMNVLY